MPFLDPRTLRVARTLLVLVLMGAFIYGARHTLIAFILAIFFAYLVEPLVARVESWRAVSRGRRAVAIAEVYVILAAIVAAIVLQMGPYLSAEGRRLLEAAPVLLDRVGSGEIVQKIGNDHGWSYNTQRHLEHFFAQYRGTILAGVKQLGLRFGVLVTEIFWVVLIPILAILFLLDARRIVEFGFWALRLRGRSRLFAIAVLRDLNTMAAHYIRAQLTLAGLALVAYTTVLVASGVQYGLILGVTAGILEFIPMVGPLIGATAMLSVAFLTGFHHVWLLAAFLAGWRLLQDYFNAPKLMQKTVKLHPPAVIFAVLSGGEIAGFLGVFLSIPLAATVQIILQRWETYAPREDVADAHEVVQKIRAA